MPEILSPSSGNSNASAPNKTATADDINDLFKTLDVDDSSKSDDKESQVAAPKKAKEAKELTPDSEDDEIKLVEPDDDDVEKIDLSKEDEDLDIDAPPRKAEILKKYPDLFKDFKYLEKVLYRDKAYNELFGSFDDAKEASEQATNFKEFEGQLLSGNTREILKNVKEADPKAYDKIIDDYLPSLAEIDREAYLHVVGNLNKRLIMEMISEAEESNDADLKQAALIVNRFVFSSNKFTPPVNRVNHEVDTKQNEIENERRQFIQERLDSSINDLQGRVDNTLKATISEYIDPKNVMSSYVKKNAVADALKILTEHITEDPTVAKTLNKLWGAAADAKFSQDSLKRIQKFYLGKARGGLKPAILKARAEALKDSAPRKKEEDVEEVEETTPLAARRGLVSPGRTSQPKGKNEMKRGESVADFFARD